MRLTTQDCKPVTKTLAQRYRRASKKEKGRLFDGFWACTGHNRVYAVRLLRGHGHRVEVLAALKKVWQIMDYICGKRLAAILSAIVHRLVRSGELTQLPQLASDFVRK